MVKSEHHGGREVPLYRVLGDLASQENCDGFEYDVMQEASEYIYKLESILATLEQNFLG
jgi:hypothetical protein